MLHLTKLLKTFANGNKNMLRIVIDQIVNLFRKKNKIDLLLQAYNASRKKKDISQIPVIVHSSIPSPIIAEGAQTPANINAGVKFWTNITEKKTGTNKQVSVGLQKKTRRFITGFGRRSRGRGA
jgi:hypothetical protein